MKSKRVLSDTEITEILTDSDKLTLILQTGIYAALLKHKQAGNPVCEWRDNKVVWVPPESIPVAPPKTLDKSK